MDTVYEVRTDTRRDGEHPQHRSVIPAFDELLTEAVNALEYAAQLRFDDERDWPLHVVVNGLGDDGVLTFGELPSLFDLDEARYEVVEAIREAERRDLMPMVVTIDGELLTLLAIPARPETYSIDFPADLLEPLPEEVDWYGGHDDARHKAFAQALAMEMLRFYEGDLEYVVVTLPDGRKVDVDRDGLVSDPYPAGQRPAGTPSKVAS